MPRAYTLQEGNSIKSFADLCFGHYDKNTQMLAKYKPLGDFLARMFEKNGIKPTTKCKKWVDCKTGSPKDKKAQVHSDSIFKTSVGYALSKTVMTCHNINRDGWFYDNSVRLTNNSI